MNNKKARCKEINSRFYGTLPLSLRGSEATEAISRSRFFSKPGRKINLLFIILILFLISSFLASASSQSINMTNIWYKKLPNYTHITIKASGAILEYNVFYLDEPDRIVIDVKNAFYNIEELAKNALFLNMGSVKQVRCGQFESKPIPITRFVVDLFQKSDYEVTLSSDSRLIYVDVYDYTEFKTPEEQVFTVTPVKSEVVKIEKEEVKKSIVDTVTKTINMNLKEVEVVDAIRALSEISGIDIVVDDSVEGKITLNLKDKSFKDSLDLITKLKGLDYTEVTGTLIIAKKDVIESYKEPITKIFELKNASVDEAKVILDNYIKEGVKGSINIVADSRLNTLIVTGGREEIEKVKNLITTIDKELSTETFKINNAIREDEIESIKGMLGIIIPEEERVIIDARQSEIIVKGSREELNNVKTMISGLDKRAPQIMIEAKVVEITLDGEKDLGIKWVSGDAKLEGQITIGEITLGGSFERSGLIEATLKALQTEGKTNILSNPKVLTLDGKEAKILSGSKIPIRVITPEGTETIEYRDVGLSMTITPRLSSDGLITMEVNPKIESLGEELIQGYPVINSREENVIIRTYLGKTEVIGGLITSEDIKNIRKIPFLADIPIFGKLFKFTHTKNKKTELIILITAHKLDY